MAIAFVAGADGGNNTGGTGLTYSYTCGSGANRLLVVGVAGDATVDDVTGVTYAGVSMTLAAKKAATGTNNRVSYLFYLLAPATGANNVVISASTAHYILSGAADYTGVKQSAQPDATATANGTGSVLLLTSSVTTVANNSWAILLENGYGSNTPPTASTGVTRRTFDAVFGGWGLFDSNAAITPAGSYSMTTQRTNASDTITHVGASFQPDTGGAAVIDRHYYDMIAQQG